MDGDPAAPRISAASIRAFAESLGVAGLAEDVAAAQAADVEYRLRQIVQEALKFMRHGKRSVLTTEDINAALRLRNVEPVFGWHGGREPVEYARAEGHPELLFMKDREVNLEDEIRAPLPRPPIETHVTAHWLAIDGVQPRIPENPAPAEVAPTAVPASAPQPAHGGVVVQPVVAHVISEELQLYFEQITSMVTREGPDGPKEIYESLATDSGLQPLAPYFTQWLASEVASRLGDLPRLRSAMRAAAALLSNQRLTLEQYLHQLMPALLTCLVAKKLSATPEEDHWALRDAAAGVLAQACGRHGVAFPNVQPRVTKTLLKALLDETRPPATHYGALAGLAALGPRVVRALILPNAPALVAASAAREAAAGDAVAAEAAGRVRGALLAACGGAAYAAMRPLLPPAPAAAARGARLDARGAPVAKASAAPPRLPAGGEDTEEAEEEAQPARGRGKAAAAKAGKAAPKQNKATAAAEAEAEAEAAAAAGAPPQPRAAPAMDEEAAAAAAAVWREDADLGPLFKVLADAFGDAWTPFVPTAPLVHLSV